MITPPAAGGNLRQSPENVLLADAKRQQSMAAGLPKKETVESPVVNHTGGCRVRVPPTASKATNGEKYESKEIQAVGG